MVSDGLGHFRVHLRENVADGAEEPDAEGDATEQEGIDLNRKYRVCSGLLIYVQLWMYAGLKRLF